MSVVGHPFLQQLLINIATTGNQVCVGLDPDIELLPEGFDKSLLGVEDFLRTVIDASRDLVIAYKPNISFFEAYGVDGLRVLERIVTYVPSYIPVIIDAKRGDIGNTSRMQAKFIFESLNASATTVHPYMGEDSVVPFLEYTSKFTFVLGLTSNPGASDFELMLMQDGRPLYHHVLKRILEWNQRYHNVGAVVGATQNLFKTICQDYPELDFLVPGVGAQGGSYQDIILNQPLRKGLLIINVGRSVLYAAQQTPIEDAVRWAVKGLSKRI
jgi:orotidine-5'-phosphate decarboxylase